MSQFRKKPVVITAITFDELVEHGRANGANIVNGMPWSFQYNGHPITHENDDCYLIPTLEGTMKMGRTDMLITGVKGEIYPCKAAIFAATYEPADPPSVSSEKSPDQQFRAEYGFDDYKKPEPSVSSEGLSTKNLEMLAKHFPRGDQRGNSTLSGDYICKRCGGTKPTCCSCPEVRDLDAESARVRQMMKDGDTEGLAAYVNQGNRERAEVAVSRPSVSSEGSPSPAEAQRTTELQAAIDKAIEHEGDRIYDAITGYFDHVGIKYLHPEGEDSADPADWIRHLIDQVRGEQTDRVDELEDQLQRSPAAAQGWQPVESAPKDRPVLVRTADAIAVAEWHEDKYGERFSGWTRPPWPIDDAHPVTSWREIEMPLSPAPPTEDQ